VARAGKLTTLVPRLVAPFETPMACTPLSLPSVPATRPMASKLLAGGAARTLIVEVGLSARPAVWAMLMSERLVTSTVAAGMVMRATSPAPALFRYTLTQSALPTCWSTGFPKLSAVSMIVGATSCLTPRPVQVVRLHAPSFVSPGPAQVSLVHAWPM
jgi:hypothetical protein